MPTFKAPLLEYDVNLTPEGNIQNTINHVNEITQRLARTVNNLDEDNFNMDLTSKKGDEDDG